MTAREPDHPARRPTRPQQAASPPRWPASTSRPGRPEAGRLHSSCTPCLLAASSEDTCRFRVNPSYRCQHGSRRRLPPVRVLGDVHGVGVLVAGDESVQDVRTCAVRCSRWIARNAARAWPILSRRAGSLASSPSMTGRSGPARRDGAGASTRMAVSVATSEPRSKGGQPSTAVNSVAPSENRSDAGPDAPPSSRSGATYAGVPGNAPAAGETSPMAHAMPKSVRTTRPLPQRCTLAGLTSPCTMPAWCVACSASRRRRPTAVTWRTGRGPAACRACWPTQSPGRRPDVPGRSDARRRRRTAGAPCRRDSCLVRPRGPSYRLTMAAEGSHVVRAGAHPRYLLAGITQCPPAATRRRGWW